MKKFLLLVFAINSCFMGTAQQQPQFTLFWNNLSHVNPAVTGIQYTHEGGAFCRPQWTGLGNEPITVGGFYNFKIKAWNSGVGLNYLHDQLGVETYERVNLNYAYHFQIGGGTLGLGVGGGLHWKNLQYDSRPAGGTVIYNPAIPESDWSRVFNLTAGVAYRTDKLDAGLSATQLTQPTFPNDGAQNVIHYWLVAGYRIELTDALDLTPRTMFKSDGAFSQFDVNLALTYKDMVWAGIGYRNADALMPMFGYQNNFLRLGYAYDITASELTGYSHGSHEVSLTVMFN